MPGALPSRRPRRRRRRPTGTRPPSSPSCRLSSKSHWDVPIDIDGTTVHFLVSHPTPPVFDGPEDRNGTRNFDEIRFWADYITPGPTSRYIYDDEGGTGGLRPGELFVIAGDQNSDPLDGDSIPGSIQQLLEHPLVNTRVTPQSAGRRRGHDAAGRGQRRPTAATRGSTPPTSPTPHPATCAPTTCCRARTCGSSTPPCSGRSQASPLFPLTGVFPFPSSDHRAVWIDVQVPG